MVVTGVFSIIIVVVGVVVVIIIIMIVVVAVADVAASPYGENCCLLSTYSLNIVVSTRVIVSRFPKQGPAMLSTG